MTVRGADAVNRVAQQAIHNINRPGNAAKGCWSSMTRRKLWWLLLVEVGELTGALWDLYWLRAAHGRIPYCETEARQASYRQIGEAYDHVAYEIGDCVAFLAFLRDRL